MQRTLLQIFTLFCVFCLSLNVVFADSEETQVKSDVLELNLETFDDVIKNNEFVLAEFFAPWCGHCKNLAPHYEKAATTLLDTSAKLAKIDCTVENELCERFQVQGFPTLKFFKGDVNNPRDYTGPREAEGIVNWVKSKMEPSSVTLGTTEEVKTFTENKASAIYLLGYFDKDSEGAKTFLSLADVPSAEFWGIGLVTAAEVGKKNTVLLHRSFGEDVVFDKESFTLEDLLAWADEHANPYVGDVSTQYPRISARGLPMGLVFLDEEDEKERSELLAWLTPIAQTNYPRISFAYVGKMFHSRLPQFGASGEKLPTLVILKGSKYWPFDETQEFNKENVVKLVDGMIDGSIKSHFKSEPVPETNDEPVKVVVGNTFDSIVLDDTKDVLIEFYAPWCGHCKSLAPIYAKLGEHYKENDKVVIAKLDATLNDNPAVEIEGFPTIYLFLAGDKSNPIMYDGPRTVESFVSFIDGRGDTADLPETMSHQKDEL